jgi:hypothetical protein
MLTCLVPAFFIAAAVATFVSKGNVLKYFGADAKKHVSYSIAAVSGAVLAVCSCTILPLFTGIYRRGAGIGPATAFLYAGPAINILAIVFTARVLGFELGLARAGAAVLMAVFIGLLMSMAFKSQNDVMAATAASEPRIDGHTRTKAVSLIFFGSLVAILIAATADVPWFVKFPAVYVFTLVVSVLLIFHYDRTEVKEWGYETWFLTKRIVPVLLAGVFVVGLIGGLGSRFVDANPDESIGVMVRDYIGGNSISACFVASAIGAVLYMPTLLEVPVVNDLFGYGSGIMGGGPALALLLAGPSLSLPNMVVISRVMGLKKAGTYVALVVVMSAVVGYAYGVIA